MANLNEADQWEAGIYQLEEDDPVLGGPSGIDNRPPRELANRTGYLRRRGVSPWDATLSYPANVAYVSYGGTTWKSVGDSTNVVPGADPAKWVRWAFTAAELAASLGDAVAAHEAKTDPHPQYVNDAELTAGIAAHEAKVDPHPQYATDADLAAHVAHANPHAQYVRHDAAQGLTGTQATQARSNIGAEDAGAAAAAVATVQKNAPMNAVDTGTANTIVVAYTPTITVLTDGMALWVKAKVTNTGATTLAVDATSAKPVVGLAHLALQGGEIIANGKCLFVYNATLASWVLVYCTGAALQVIPSTKSQHAVQRDQATIGATLRNVNGSRSLGVTYTNTTNRFMWVFISAIASTAGSAALSATVGGIGFIGSSTNGATALSGFIAFPVPPGATYQVNAATGSFSAYNNWVEMS
ncbi:hypothetical protein [Variovorax gossypii]